MPRPRSTFTVSAKLNADLAADLDAYVARVGSGTTRSSVVAEALEEFLSGQGARAHARKVRDPGYLAGVKRGYHDLITAAQEAFEAKKIG